MSVVIVGAGPGGLSAAVLLAASGFSVRVHEAQPVVGGRTARVRVGDFSFDRGATFFMMPYVLGEIFAAAGRALCESVELTRLDPMYRLVMGREGERPLALDTTQDLAEMGRRIGAIDAGDGVAFERFMAENRAKLGLMDPILRGPMGSVVDVLRAGPPVDMARVGAMLHPTRSVHGLLSGRFNDPLVRLAFSFQSKYLGMSPFECPSLVTILPFIEYEYGVWHPRGGCNAIMHALAALAIELGVEIRTSSPVIGLEFEGKRAVGVRTAAGVDRADHVVINADAPWALKALIDERLRRPGGYTDAALDAMRSSCSTFMLYLGVDGEVELPHHTIYTCARYRENLDEIGAGRLSDDPSLYVCNPSRTDATLAPPGASSLYVLVPVPNTVAGRAVDWDVEGPRLRERVIGRVERVLGVGDLGRRIRAQRVCTPADWRGMNINAGATFSLAHSLPQMLHRRPHNKLKGLENVYLVGGGTHPGSGLPTIFLSAQISSRLLCASAGVRCALDRSRVDRRADGSGVRFGTTIQNPGDPVIMRTMEARGCPRTAAAALSNNLVGEGVRG